MSHVHFKQPQVQLAGIEIDWNRVSSPQPQPIAVAPYLVSLGHRGRYGLHSVVSLAWH